MQHTADPDALWFKDAIIYELHVRAFHDSNGDGIGDFPGLTERLDYLQDLGVTAIWLLPFSPSPLRDDGYDTSDYTGIHASYGTLSDFKRFLKAAHQRGLRVVTELVVNHTSDQHPWFQRARRAKPGSREREFYVWSDTPQRYRQARIIFKDFESSNWAWDPVANAYYWHRFFAHQPDLNFENPEVERAIFKVVDFWFDLGVDGLRLDAVPYLYEREGTNCENLPETHAFLKKLRQHVDSKYKNRLLLAEANQWPEDAVAYFGDGDECHMAFHFPVMPRLFMASRLEQRYPIVEILKQTPRIPPNCQWAVFLRNHDELTLEMVTDEERDYMYRTFADDPRMRINLGIRRRLAPLLGNNRRKIELLNGLLLSMPGTPVLYYGDEIGMGDNIYLGDRDGVRTPMQWSPDRNAGFSCTNPQKLYLPVIIDPEFHFEAINVEAQQNNPSSLLWWMKRVIALRRRYKAFGRGSVEFLAPENRKVAAFTRILDDEIILVVANLSRFTQYVELDMSRYEGMVPVELFGRTDFPRIREQAYLLTLGPHMFHWFALEKPAEGVIRAAESLEELPVLYMTTNWLSVVQPGRVGETPFDRLLPGYLMGQRWFGGKAHGIREARIHDVVPLSKQTCFVLVQVEYRDAEAEHYTLMLHFRPEREGPPSPEAALARLKSEGDGGEAGYLCDAMHDSACQRDLFAAMRQHRRFKGMHGELVAVGTQLLRGVDEPPSLLRAEQSNTSVRFGERFVLKLWRRLQEGMNPEIEMARFLATPRAFPHMAALAGYIDYRVGKSHMSLAVLQEYVHNENDAWVLALEAFDRFLERALAHPEAPAQPVSLFDCIDMPLTRAQEELLGAFRYNAEALGVRTAEMHVKLASSDANPEFAPEPFSMLYQRSLYQSKSSRARQALELLRARLETLPEGVRQDAEALLVVEEEVVQRFEVLKERRIDALRTRCHGDFHLGQVLYTGEDFVIIDFEGEPLLSISERRLKRSPLRDVAGMLRSFDYVAHVGLRRHPETWGDGHGEISLTPAQAWATAWVDWVSAAFLRTYLSVGRAGLFLPATRTDLIALLDVYMLDKAFYELLYELQNRPNWVYVPLRGILQMYRRATQRRTDSDGDTS